MNCGYGLYYGDVNALGYASGLGCVIYDYLLDYNTKTDEYHYRIRGDGGAYAFFLGKFANGMPEKGCECVCSATGHGRDEDFRTITTLQDKHKKKHGKHSSKIAIVFHSRRKRRRMVTSSAEKFGFDMPQQFLYVCGMWAGHCFKGKASMITTMGDFKGEIGDVCDVGEMICPEYRVVGTLYRVSKSIQTRGTAYYPNGDRFVGIQASETLRADDSKSENDADSTDGADDANRDDEEDTYMEGTYYYANGDVYTGRLNIDEQRHGFGVLIRDGVEVSGMWECNELID